MNPTEEMKARLTLTERVQAAAALIVGYGVENLTDTKDEALAEWAMNLVDALEAEAAKRESAR